MRSNDPQIRTSFAQAPLYGRIYTLIVEHAQDRDRKLSPEITAAQKIVLWMPQYQVISQPINVYQYSTYQRGLLTINEKGLESSSEVVHNH